MKARNFSSHRTVAALVLTAGLFLPLAAEATERIGGNAAVLPEARSVNDDLLIGGNSVVVLGKVNGDLVAADANVSISAKVASCGVPWLAYQPRGNTGGKTRRVHWFMVGTDGRHTNS